MTVLTKTAEVVGSKRGALLLFLVTAIASVPGTFMTNPAYYRTFPFLALPVLVAVATAVCTLRNGSSLPVPVLLLHVGFIITVGGFVLRSAGYVATVNVHESGSTDQAYRWDLERDLPLGYTLAVEGIHKEFFPAPVRVGVLSGDRKVALHELRIGGDFLLPPYRVVAERLDPPGKALALTILQDGAAVATVSTASDDGYPAGFPYRFRLVAFQDTSLRRMWVDLALYAGDRKIARGTTEVNRPFVWKGETFYATAVSADSGGRPYAGIQIVRDPGRPVVFTGLATACMGALLLCGRKVLWR